jgi:acetyltransferase-like isoleucine patch superfamily enzyme
VIHPLSDIQSKNIGIGTYIWQFVVVLKGAVIGENCNINAHVFIENDVVIGNSVTIKPGVQIWDGLRVEDDVFIGPNVTFTNDKNPRSKKYPKDFQQTILKYSCSIGANSTILGGVNIGQFAMIGAGSVVTKSISPFTLWFGNPCKHKGYVTKEGKVLSIDLLDKNKTKYYLNFNNEPTKVNKL